MGSHTIMLAPRAAVPFTPSRLRTPSEKLTEIGKLSPTDLAALEVIMDLVLARLTSQ